MLTYEEFERLREKEQRGQATEAELNLLEPYRVKRAVLLASGMGSRMAPITISTPKPLVRVNGRRIIDTILDALYAIDVKEIYIVRGYLKEVFDQLLEKYPTIKFIDNPSYETMNNISSAVLAREHFQNAYVTEADFYLKNPWFVQKYQYDSNYIGVPVDQTEDWCFSSQGGYITDLKKGGSGQGCHHMYAFSHWTAEDGARLVGDIAEEFQKEENRQRFWDDVPCVLRKENYRVRIRQCSFDDIAEIDSFDELKEIDPAYAIK